VLGAQVVDQSGPLTDQSSLDLWGVCMSSCR